MQNFCFPLFVSLYRIRTVRSLLYPAKKKIILAIKKLPADFLLFSCKTLVPKTNFLSRYFTELWYHVKINMYSKLWFTAQSFINLNNHKLLKIHWNINSTCIVEIYTENHTHLTQIFYPGNPTWENQHSVYLSISISRKVQKFTISEICSADKLIVQICCPSSIPNCLPISESPIMKWYTLAWDPLNPKTPWVCLSHIPTLMHSQMHAHAHLHTLSLSLDLLL